MDNAGFIEERKILQDSNARVLMNDLQKAYRDGDVLPGQNTELKLARLRDLTDHLIINKDQLKDIKNYGEDGKFHPRSRAAREMWISTLGKVDETLVGTWPNETASYVFGIAADWEIPGATKDATTMTIRETAVAGKAVDVPAVALKLREHVFDKINEQRVSAGLEPIDPNDIHDMQSIDGHIRRIVQNEVDGGTEVVDEIQKDQVKINNDKLEKAAADLEIKLTGIHEKISNLDINDPAFSRKQSDLITTGDAILLTTIEMTDSQGEKYVRQILPSAQYNTKKRALDSYKVTSAILVKYKTQLQSDVEEQIKSLMALTPTEGVTIDKDLAALAEKYRDRANRYQSATVSAELGKLDPTEQDGHMDTKYYQKDHQSLLTDAAAIEKKARGDPEKFIPAVVEPPTGAQARTQVETYNTNSAAVIARVLGPLATPEQQNEVGDEVGRLDIAMQFRGGKDITPPQEEAGHNRYEAHLPTVSQGYLVQLEGGGHQGFGIDDEFVFEVDDYHTQESKPGFWRYDKHPSSWNWTFGWRQDEPSAERPQRSQAFRVAVAKEKLPQYGMPLAKIMKLDAEGKPERDAAGNVILNRKYFNTLRSNNIPWATVAIGTPWEREFISDSDQEYIWKTVQLPEDQGGFGILPTSMGVRYDYEGEAGETKSINARALKMIKQDIEEANAIQSASYTVTNYNRLRRGLTTNPDRGEWAKGWGKTDDLQTQAESVTRNFTKNKLEGNEAGADPQNPPQDTEKAEEPAQSPQAAVKE